MTNQIKNTDMADLKESFLKIAAVLQRNDVDVMALLSGHTQPIKPMETLSFAGERLYPARPGVKINGVELSDYIKTDKYYGKTLVYDISLKHKQIYNGENVYYSDTDWFARAKPLVEAEALKKYQKPIDLIWIEVMATNDNGEHYTEIKNPKYAKKDKNLVYRALTNMGYSAWVFYDRYGTPAVCAMHGANYCTLGVAQNADGRDALVNAMSVCFPLSQNIQR